MIGLKYTGKKIPFVFKNENLQCESMAWQKRGDIIKVPKPDAEFMAKHSGHDFHIVGHDDSEDDTPEVIVKEKPKKITPIVKERPRCGEIKTNGKPCMAAPMANGKCRSHGGKNEIEEPIQTLVDGKSPLEDVDLRDVGKDAEHPELIL